MPTTVPVRFRAPGTWGPREFTAALTVQCDSVPDRTTSRSAPVLVIDDVPSNGPWAGRSYYRATMFEGRFAEGYSSEFSGHLYRGDFEIQGVTLPPAEVFDGGQFCLNLNTDIHLDAQQRQVLIDACVAGSPVPAFMPGTTIVEAVGVDTLKARWSEQVAAA